jgi:hypothetical protein
MPLALLNFVLQHDVTWSDASAYSCCDPRWMSEVKLQSECCDGCLEQQCSLQDMIFSSPSSCADLPLLLAADLAVTPHRQLMHSH